MVFIVKLRIFKKYDIYNTTNILNKGMSISITLQIINRAINIVQVEIKEF